MAIKNNKSTTQRFVKLALALSLMPGSVDSLNQQSLEFEENENLNPLNVEKSSGNSLNNEDSFLFMEVKENTDCAYFEGNEKRFQINHNNNKSKFNELNSQTKSDNKHADFKNIASLVSKASATLKDEYSHIKSYSNDYKINENGKNSTEYSEAKIFNQYNEESFSINIEDEDAEDDVDANYYKVTASDSINQTTFSENINDEIWNLSSNLDDQMTYGDVESTLNEDSWLICQKNNTPNLDECFLQLNNKASPWLIPSDESNRSISNVLDLSSNEDETASVISVPPTFLLTYQCSSNSDSFYDETETNSCSPFNVLKDSNFPMDNHIINMNFNEFQELCKRLNPDDQRKFKEMRRRGKNKMAARSCRRRKMDNLDSLNDEVKQLESHYEQLSNTAFILEKEISSLHEKINGFNASLNKEIHSSILMAN